MAGIVIALAVGVELWRMHSQNAIGCETVPVERGAIQASVTATGTVNAIVDVQVGSQVSGNIKAVYADFNTKVTKGQLVALIDPQVFQTQVDQAQAAVAAAQSQVWGSTHLPGLTIPILRAPIRCAITHIDPDGGRLILNL